MPCGAVAQPTEGDGVLTYCFSDEGNCFGRRERYKALPNY